MSEADELFDKAYAAHVVDERTTDAIDLCRLALELEPDHYRARVFLGMLLDDHGGLEQRTESRGHFVEAIRRASTLKALCESGYEESAVYHLGLWEIERGHRENACLLFLTDALLCKSQASYEYLMKLLDDPMKSVAEEIRRLVRAEVGQPNNSLNRTRDEEAS